MVDFDGKVKKKFRNCCKSEIAENCLIGYILEVDLEYPDELHNLHNVYPPNPKNLKISYDMLSNYYSHISDKHETKIGGINKLVSNLCNKSKYIVCYVCH